MANIIEVAILLQIQIKVSFCQLVYKISQQYIDRTNRLILQAGLESMLNYYFEIYEWAIFRFFSIWQLLWIPLYYKSKGGPNFWHLIYPRPIWYT